MWFLGKVAIICFVQFAMIPCTHTKPHTFLKNNQAKGNNKNYLSPVQAATDFKNSDRNSESILKAFNFHDIEYPGATTPRSQQFYFQDFNDNQSPQRIFLPDASNIKIHSDFKPARNGTVHNLQKFVKPTIKSNAIKPKSLSILPVAFTSDSDFINVVNFPEVDYPLSAKETWKPNYWNIPSDCRHFNALAEDLKFNQSLANTYPTRNLGISSKLKKCPSFSIKSYSDTTKNKERLKQIVKYKTNNTSNKQKNSTSQKDFIVNRKKNATNDNKTLPTEKTVQELHTTAMPYYFTPIEITSNCEELNTDFLNSNTFSIFNKSNHNSYASMPIQHALISKVMKTDDQFIDNDALNLKEKSTIVLKHNNSNQRDMTSNHNQEIKYDLFDITDIRKPETSNDLCGLDDDYTTDIYSEEKNIGWFSHPISTPSPFSATTVDLAWKNCKIIAPCEFNVDELEDYYISV